MKERCCFCWRSDDERWRCVERIEVREESDHERGER